MMHANLSSLLKFLREKKYNAEIQKETGQIYVILTISGKEFPMFIRVFEPSDLLQILVFMPCKLKPGTHSDLARFLHLVNKELDVPGFGMDESSEVAFYRCMLPIPGKKVDSHLFETFLKTVTLVCESVSPSVIAVASGLATYSDILQKAKEARTNSPS